MCLLDIATEKSLTLVVELLHKVLFCGLSTLAFILKRAF